MRWTDVSGVSHSGTATDIVDEELPYVQGEMREIQAYEIDKSTRRSWTKHGKLDTVGRAALFDCVPILTSGSRP